MTDLARPSFVDLDPTTVEQGVIQTFEAALGKTLLPGQLERLLANAGTYRELLTRVAIQSAGEQSLVNYATGVNLDQLGGLTDTPRIAAQAAQVTIQFTREGDISSPLIIPSSTRVAPGGSDIRFALDTDLTIDANSPSSSGTCTATTTGADGNGFTAGQINTLVDLVGGVTLNVSNTTTSASGADVESDDRYRERIKLAPNKYSVAGSKGAYEFWALSADSTITAVAVEANPPNLTINVYVLTGGLPSQTVIDAVATTLNADTVRPLTDIVNVQAPTEISYDLNVRVTAYASAEQSALQAALDAAALAYTSERASGLGNDLVQSQIISALSLTGVYSVEVVSPANTTVSSSQWANASSRTITIIGTEEG